jgi:glycosyltransferase involved in cell wall biosynthesis
LDPPDKPLDPQDQIANVIPEISIVVPLRDEDTNVIPLHQELTGVLRAHDLSYEIIFIDDGSEDETFERLSEIHARDLNVRVIRFTRNFGQTAAFAAGFAHARGHFVATLDGDLQNDPADIPRLLQLARNHDIVCGWRKHRKDAFLTRHVPSVVANWLIGVVTGIRLHDQGCSLKVFRTEVVKPLRLSPGMHRYLPAIASQRGERVAEVVVNHRPRRSGRSKYGLSRTFGVVRDIVRFRRLMRQAIDPASVPPRLYEIQETLEATRNGVDAVSSRPVSGDI